MLESSCLSCSKCLATRELVYRKGNRLCESEATEVTLGYRLFQCTKKNFLTCEAGAQTAALLPPGAFAGKKYRRAARIAPDLELMYPEGYMIYLTAMYWIVLRCNSDTTNGFSWEFCNTQTSIMLPIGLQCALRVEPEPALC